MYAPNKLLKGLLLLLAAHKKKTQKTGCEGKCFNYMTFISNSTHQSEMCFMATASHLAI